MEEGSNAFKIFTKYEKNDFDPDCIAKKAREGRMRYLISKTIYGYMNMLLFLIIMLFRMLMLQRYCTGYIMLV